VKNNGVKSVIDFGCGDGDQLSLFDFPSYVGLDVSESAIKLCMNRFKEDGTKSFFLYDLECFKDNSGIFRADLTLSLDVIYHLIEDNIFELYMEHLFSSSDKFVIIYSDDVNTNQRRHEKHRQFTKWIEINLSSWELINKIENRFSHESCASFFVYKRIKQRKAGGF
jgi:cyclopropane fatty-acyl-phospholipid synthase-like methyltransferase